MSAEEPRKGTQNRNSPTGADLDVEAIREKYRREREKRLREEGTDQFNFAEGRYSHFDDDPWADPPAPRDPLVEELDLLVIGAGLGGLITSITALDNGIEDFRIIDVTADFGGTWYWNRYPGIRCDVESYIYLPYLERTGHMPTERYVRGDEILEYCRTLGRQFGLYERAVFQTKVEGLEWDEEAARWIVTSDRGDRFAARFVVTQSGIFSRPQLPGIPGIEDFEGKIFHSSRWDYEYTGGDSHGGMEKLADKRVGVVGTGATGLQIIPELARDAGSLTVFQRTPTAVNVRDNGPTDREWFESLPKGWQREREVTFNQISNGENVECPVEDGWARFFYTIIDAIAALPEEQREDPEAIGAAAERADFGYNELLRERVDNTVRDAEKASLLKAYYRTLCKRPGFSDDYLPAFDQDNVTLVDASTGIERITPRGVEIDGAEYELDCLIFATGFELGTTWAHQAGYDVIGRGGQAISEKWAEGMRTYHGLFSVGFPNLFFLGLTQTGTTISVPHMIQEQATHLTFVVAHALRDGIAEVEATEEAEAAWQETLAVYNETVRRPFQEACTPGYFNAEGKPGDRRSAIGSGIYAPSTQFFADWEAWREEGKFEGLVRR
jgi:cyclohexanone monooxygenase